MLEQSKSRSNKTAAKTKTATAHSTKPNTKKISPRHKQTASLVITPQQRQQMIQEAAYYIAKSRGFIGGNPMDDWLAAEAEIDKQLLQAPR